MSLLPDFCCPKAKTLLGLMVSVLLLTACASPTLTPQDCALGAWYAVGHDDGIQGKDSSILSSHKKACSQYGVQIDTSQYRRGYKDGNKAYCEGYNHYQAGVVGEAHVSVCPGEAYRSQHRQGVEVYCKNFDHLGRGEAGGPFNSRCPEYPYQQQYNEGVTLYCSKTNPYELGRVNASYTSNICGRSFDRAYRLGSVAIRIEQKIERADEELYKHVQHLIDEEDPEQAEELRKSIQHLELDIREQRKELLKLKVEVKDLGYLNSDDLLEDLIELAL